MQENPTQSSTDVSVSIVIPCYNQGPWLWEAVESALLQDLEGVEVIVVNDGSTDPVTNRIVSEMTDPRVRVICTANQGLASARNEGIRQARGTYILPLDSDDRIHPTYARKAVEVLEQHAHVGIVYCRAELFGEQQGEWQLEPYDFPGILLSPQLFASSVFRKADWESVGGYQSDMIYGWEDYDFWLSLIARGVGVHRIDEVLFYYRKTEGSMAGLDRKRMLYSFRKMFEHHRDLYEANIECLFGAVIDSKPERDRRALKVRDVFEVFIPDSEGYAGRNIRSQNYTRGVWSRIAILLERVPEAGIHLLRLDPGTSVGVVDIASVKLLHASTGAVLYEAADHVAFDGFTLGEATHVLPHDRFLRLFCAGGDGHLFLPVVERSVLEQPLLLEVWIHQHTDLEAVSERCDQVQSDRVSQQQLQQSQESVHEHEVAVVALREELERQRVHASELEKVREVLQRNQEAARSEANQAKLLVETLQSELRQAHGEVRRLGELSSNQQAELDAARQRIAELEASVKGRRSWFRRT